MSETKGKQKFDLPSAEKVQEELSKAESMDDFFGKDGIFAKLFASTMEQVKDVQVRDAAVLIAAGVNWDGKRDILGVSEALGEQEVHWRSFLQSLVQRGLQGVRLIISDAHAGLRAARHAVFGGIPWQRCQFHLQHILPIECPGI